MRYLFVIVAGLYLSILCGCDTKSAASNAASLSTPDSVSSQNAVQPYTLLTLADAEKILGEPAVLRDSTYKSDAQSTIYRCTYAAPNSEQGGARRRAVYFYFEEYPREATAHDVYARIKEANQHHEGIKTLQGIGDEAYFHSDGKNFYYIMVRKGRRGFRIKATKIIAITSAAEFNEIARRIASAI